jgi:hypothetical protein
VTWLAAYHFDDTGSVTVVDATGNGYTIDLTGQPAQQSGGALAKTGAGTVPLPAALRTAAEADDRTIMVDLVGASRFVWAIRSESVSLDTGVFGLLSLDSGGTILSRARDQANVGPSATITIGALHPTVEHNFALTYKRSTGVLTGYYDGAQVGTATFAAGTPLYVGADALNIAEWASTGPSLDNLRIANHCADAAEVASLAGTPVTSGPAPIEEAEFAIALNLEVSPSADVPALVVPEAEFEIPLQLSIAAEAVMPVATVPSAALTIPLLLDVAPAGLAEPMPATTESGGWGALGAIGRWNRDQLEYERSTPPLDCPIHGDPLDVRGSKRHCRMGHFV